MVAYGQDYNLETLVSFEMNFGLTEADSQHSPDVAE